MDELVELETRLKSAMDRLEAGVSDLGNGGADVDALQSALDAAKAANSEFEDGLAKQQDRLGALDAELQRMRAVNDQLEQNNKVLREACQAGQVEPALINQAMLTELESLRAQRSLEKAEAEAAMASRAARTRFVSSNATSGEEHAAPSSTCPPAVSRAVAASVLPARSRTPRTSSCPAWAATAAAVKTPPIRP